MSDLKRRHGLSYLPIAHDLRVAGHFSDRVPVMYGGRIVEGGNHSDIWMHPRTGYTRQLLDAVPTFDGA